MISRTIAACICLWTLAQTAALAQTAFVPSLGGRVFADGRPVSWVIEVRLEGQDSSMVAAAHTRGSSEFLFSNVMLQARLTYFLVIKEPGYQELRFALDPNDFARDSRNPGVLFYKGRISLNIESVPSEEKANQKPVPKAVDAEQIRVQIPAKARQEYDQGLRDIAAGKNGAALKHLEKAVDLEPKYYDALNKLGAEYIKAGEYRKAETVLQRARSLNPNDALPLTNLGVLYFEEGERLSAAGGGAGGGSEAVKASYRKAVDLLEEALRLDRLSPRTNFYLGTALYRFGDLERAESRLINALALDGRMHQARLTLLNIYIRQNRYDDVLAQIAAYLGANPDAPQRLQMEKLKAQIENSRRK